MWTTITLEVLVTPWDWERPNTRTQGWNAQLWLPTGAGTGTLGPLCCTNLTVCMASEKKLSFFVSGCERRSQDHGPTASSPWDDRTLHWQQTDQTGTVSGGEGWDPSPCIPRTVWALVGQCWQRVPGQGATSTPPLSPRNISIPQVGLPKHLGSEIMESLNGLGWKGP